MREVSDLFHSSRSSRSARSPPSIQMYFTETNHGAFTANGNKYLTTPQTLQRFGGIKTELENVYRTADLWLDAPLTAAVLMLPIALHIIPLPIAALLLTLFFWIWAELTFPPKASYNKGRWMSFFGNPFFQIGWYVALMGLLVYLCIEIYPNLYPNRTITFPYEAIGISVVMFLLWKSGLLSKIFKGAFEKSREKRYAYPAEDVALHALLASETNLDLKGLQQHVATVVKEAEAL